MTKSNIKGKLSFKSVSEQSAEMKILKNLQSRKIPDNELLENLGMFLSSKNLSRILCLDFLYKQQIKINGNIFDFGTRWGQNASLFSTLEEFMSLLIGIKRFLHLILFLDSIK